MVGCLSVDDQIIASLRSENDELRAVIADLRAALLEERRAHRETAGRLGRLEGKTGERAS